jgi:hypothetical protein
LTSAFGATVMPVAAVLKIRRKLRRLDAEGTGN